MGRAVTGAYEAPRHKAANWVGRGRGRKSTRPGASGVVELSPFEFFDRLADAHQKPRSHDTSRVTWAKLMARVGEEFPFACPGCGGDIRLIAFITDPGPIRKILAHLGEPLEPPPRRGKAGGLGKAWCAPGRQEHATHEPLISPAMLEEVPLAGLSFARSAATASPALGSQDPAPEPVSGPPQRQRCQPTRPISSRPVPCGLTS